MKARCKFPWMLMQAQLHTEILFVKYKHCISFGILSFFYGHKTWIKSTIRPQGDWNLPHLCAKMFLRSLFYFYLLLKHMFVPTKNKQKTKKGKQTPEKSFHLKFLYMLCYYYYYCCAVVVVGSYANKYSDFIVQISLLVLSSIYLKPKLVILHVGNCKQTLNKTFATEG